MGSDGKRVDTDTYRRSMCRIRLGHGPCGRSRRLPALREILYDIRAKLGDPVRGEHPLLSKPVQFTIGTKYCTW